MTIGTRERPADITLLHYDSRPLALDITTTHPLRPSSTRDCDAQQTFLSGKEVRKNNKYSLLCNREGWLFHPLAFHPWGGFGPLTSKFLQTYIRRIAGDCHGRTRSHLISSFWQTIGQGIAKGVAQQLQESLLSCPVGPSLTPTLYQLAPHNPTLTDALGNLLQPLPRHPPSEQAANPTPPLVQTTDTTMTPATCLGPRRARSPSPTRRKGPKRQTPR